MASLPKGTIYLDERGTPLDGIDGDHLFVVAGIAIRGDDDRVAREWKVVEGKNPRLQEKGTDYSRTEFLDLVEFLSANGVLPIASFTRVSDADRGLLEQRLAEGAPGHTASNYAWVQHMGMATTCGVVGLALHLGSVSELRVFLDRKSLKSIERTKFEQLLRNWLDDPATKLLPMVSALTARFANAPEVAALRASLQSGQLLTRLSLKSTGPLAKVADGVCALYGKARLGDHDATDAWGVVCARFAKNGRLPACMDMDFSTTARRAMVGRDDARP